MHPPHADVIKRVIKEVLRKLGMGKGSHPCREAKEKLHGKVHPFLQLPAVKVKTIAALVTWICANDCHEHCTEGEQ